MMAHARKTAPARALAKKASAPGEWRMYWLIYNSALESDVNDMLSVLEITAYSRWDEVKGSGRSGPHLNDEVWPAVNALYFFAAPAALETDLIAQIAGIRRQFPGEGIKLIVQPCLGVH